MWALGCLAHDARQAPAAIREGLGLERHELAVAGAGRGLSIA